MRHSGSLFLFILIAVLGGCAAPQPQQVPLPSESAAKVAAVPDMRSPKELFMESLEALEEGEPEKARPLLQQLLVLEPDHKHGKNLLQQIDANPIEMLGKDYFLYKSQPGDSLSRIAKQFLGDPYKYYILAKYNGILVPGRLEVGQTIKVPGKRTVRTPAPQQAAQPSEVPTVSDTSDVRLAEAKKLHAAGRYQDAINVLETTLRDEGGGADLKELLVTVYVSYSRELLGAGRPADAQRIISKALAMFPDNKRLKAQHEQVNQQVSTEQLYQGGLKAMKAGQLTKAYDAFTKTLAVQPDHGGAKAKQAQIRPAVIEYYHRIATQAYRKQNLDEAISNWDRVLEIDPNNTLARTNRAKAVELKEHLGRLR